MTTHPHIHLDSTGSVHGLESLLARAACDKKPGEGLLILSAEANGFTAEAIDGLLRNTPMPLLGGVFPRIIVDGQAMVKGTLVATVPMASESYFVPGLSDEGVRFAVELERLFPVPPEGRTMVVFVDGGGLRIEAFVEGLFDVFGLGVNYVGGGAGSLRLDGAPCLLTNGGLRGGGAVFAFLSGESGVGVCHGWRELSGPFQVTEVYHNVIKTLDWRPALDVYAEAIAPHCTHCIHEQGFYPVAKRYPFGISRLDAEQIVRDPIWVGEDKSLICAGEIAPASFVHILQSDSESLIAAARLALGRAETARGRRGPASLLLFMDCISRALFLEDAYSRELEAVNTGGCPMIGACTIGEIANCGEEFLEFYNKTAVAALIDIA